MDGDLERDGCRRLKDKNGYELSWARMHMIGYEKDCLGSPTGWNRDRRGRMLGP